MKLDDVTNAGKDSQYHLKRLGEFGETAKPGMINSMTKSAYEIAKDGGKHAGMLKSYREKPVSMIERAIRSMKKQIDLQESWIENPYLKLKPDEEQRRVSALVNKKWPDDIQRINEQADVLRGLLQEKRQ